MTPPLTFSDVKRLEATTSAAEVPLGMDQEAFGAFYERTARPLWAYLSRVTGDRHLADDLLQETYYRFLRSAAGHESEQHRRNALFHIAANLVKDGRRRQATRPVVAEHAAGGLEQHPDPRGPTLTEQRADLGRAMARLRPRDRTLLWLAYAQGASHREIAEVLGVQVASIKQMLSRARHRLAERLGGARANGAGGGGRG